jgi:2-polyprenyl-6-methoxyphenol hydroxylase-like FAD-dependent oxidoreductase
MVGNAIHAVHPITGQGMNLAIEDVGELVNCLDAYFNNQSTLQEALLRYQTERYPVNEAVVNYGHSLATTFHQREDFAACLNLHMQGSGRDTSYIHKLQAAQA